LNTSFSFQLIADSMFGVQQQWKMSCQWCFFLALWTTKLQCFAVHHHSECLC